MDWISFKPTKGSSVWKEPCFLCNNWIKKDEYLYCIRIPADIEKKYEAEIKLKLKSKSFIVHKDEWDNYVEGLSDEEILQKLLKHKKPKREPISEETLIKCENFKKACMDFGYNKCVISKNKRFVKMKKRKTSSTIIYDTVFNKITHDSNARSGLFDGLFILSFLAKIENKFNEYCGSENRNDFSVEKILNEAMEDVNKIMK